jgi:hypothetical protein
MLKKCLAFSITTQQSLPWEAGHTPWFMKSVNIPLPLQEPNRLSYTSLIKSTLPNPIYLLNFFKILALELLLRLLRGVNFEAS